MSSVEKISVSLPRDMIEDIKDAVEHGSYVTTSEVVREAVRDWQKRRASERDERLRPRSKEDLRRLIREGAESLHREGGIPAEQVFAEMTAKYKAMLKRKKRR
jgi:antitoxin ParD1/3/4